MRVGAGMVLIALSFFLFDACPTSQVTLSLFFFVLFVFVVFDSSAMSSGCLFTRVCVFRVTLNRRCAHLCFVCPQIGVA
jgi:hypothetical protein